MTVTKDVLSNEVYNEHQELLIDSYISQSCNLEEERELKPWIPDDDDPQFPELDNIFDGPWNRLLCTPSKPRYLSFLLEIFYSCGVHLYVVVIAFFDPRYLLIFYLVNC